MVNIMENGETQLTDQQAAIARDLAQALGTNKPLAVFDLETTGTYVRSDRVVEIAILRIDVDGTATYKVRRLNPEMSIPADATAVHGISDADVAAEPTFRQVANSLAEFLEGCDLVGYNLRWFDVPILQEEFARAGVKFELAGRAVIDACAIFKMNERRDLATAYGFYCGKELQGAHGAGADTLATMEVLLKQMERYGELPRTAAGLHEYCRDPSWVDDDGKFKWRGGEAVFSFGKHAGAPLREVAETAPDYLDWMLEADFPDETLAILRDAKEGSFPDPDAGSDSITGREENRVESSEAS